MDQVREGYDAWAERYDDGDPSTALDEPWIARLSRPLTGMSALDVACGTGRYTRLLHALGARVVGADLSPKMVARARRASPQIPFVIADATRLPFADASFARVTCGLMLDHVEDPCAPFSELERVLAPRGRLVVSVVHPAMQRLTGPTIALDDGVTIPGRIHELETIVGCAARVGLLPLALEELRVGGTMASDPRWAWRVGVPALAVLAFSRPGPPA